MTIYVCADQGENNGRIHKTFRRYLYLTAAVLSVDRKSHASTIAATYSEQVDTLNEKLGWYTSPQTQSCGPERGARAARSARIADIPSPQTRYS